MGPIPKAVGYKLLALTSATAHLTQPWARVLAGLEALG